MTFSKPSCPYRINLNTIYLATLMMALDAEAAWADDGISIGGTDSSSQMKEVANVITTMQHIGFHWVAPALGSGLAIVGLFQIATRRVGMGLLALGGGSALFAVEKIATSLSHIGGN